MSEQRKSERCKKCGSNAKLRYRDKEGKIVLECLICKEVFPAERESDRVEFKKLATEFS